MKRYGNLERSPIFGWWGAVIRTWIERTMGACIVYVRVCLGLVLEVHLQNKIVSVTAGASTRKQYFLWMVA